MLMPVHPGRILAREMAARDLTAHALALRLRVPANRITLIVAGTRSISAETALRLGRFFKTGPELWIRLQADYDLAKAEHHHGDKIRAEVEEAA
jgi:addiction module HigA family antidote